jgi:hypothetical protein
VTRTVVITGYDSRQPNVPFTFAWGDGQQTNTFFPAAHTYADASRTYVVWVTAHYPDDTSDSAAVFVHFQPGTVLPSFVDPKLVVTIPAAAPTLGTRLYPPPGGLEAFAESDFSLISRQRPNNFFQRLRNSSGRMPTGMSKVNDGFQQVMLAARRWAECTPLVHEPGGRRRRRRHLSFPSGIMGLLHEMGHNVSLNSPASFRLGGRLDGNANAIHSETMAQIFSYVTAYDLIRNGTQYGLDCTTRRDIASVAVRDAKVARQTYEDYRALGHPFSSWNDPESPSDDTFLTFGTLTYTFLSHSVSDGVPPALALQRLMGLLQTFDESMLEAYDPQHDTEAADTFRSTLMVAAISEAFDRDLRNEFRELGFPLDDSTFLALRARH